MFGSWPVLELLLNVRFLVVSVVYTTWKQLQNHVSIEVSGRKDVFSWKRSHWETPLGKANPFLLYILIIPKFLLLIQIPFSRLHALDQFSLTKSAAFSPIPYAGICV